MLLAKYFLFIAPDWVTSSENPRRSAGIEIFNSACQARIMPWSRSHKISVPHSDGWCEYYLKLLAVSAWFYAEIGATWLNRKILTKDQNSQTVHKRQSVNSMKVKLCVFSQLVMYLCLSEGLFMPLKWKYECSHPAEQSRCPGCADCSGSVACISAGLELGGEECLFN